jgi:hypothetical protein
MPARVKLLKVSPSEVPFYEPHEYLLGTAADDRELHSAAIPAPP